MRAGLALIVAGCGLAVAGCAADDGASDDAGQTSPEASEPAPSESPEPSTDDGDETGSDDSCASGTAYEIAGDALAEVPLPDELEDATWDVDGADVSGFDPCTGLTQIVATVVDATASSPYTILLFHDGEWLGTATKESYPFTPVIERVDPDEIRVVYAYLQDGDANADPKGEAVATFAWNEETASVDMTGDVPPVP